MANADDVTSFLQHTFKALDVQAKLDVNASWSVRLDADTIIWSVIPATKDDAAVLIGPGGSIASGLRAVVEMAGRRLKRNYILDVSGEPSS